MAELYFDQGSISRALAQAWGDGSASSLGETLGRAIAEGITGNLGVLRLDIAPNRDQLAAMAMQGMLADESEGRNGMYSLGGLAQRAYDIAEAMLAERVRRSDASPGTDFTWRQVECGARDPASPRRCVRPAGHDGEHRDTEENETKHGAIDHSPGATP